MVVNVCSVITHRSPLGPLWKRPPGPDSVHQLLNYSDRPANLILASTMIPREVVDYPDSGKRGIGVAGLAGDTPMTRVMLRDGELLGPDPSTYFRGEPVEEPLGEPPAPPAQRDPRIVTLRDVAWEPYEMGPFRAGRKTLPPAPARRTSRGAPAAFPAHARPLRAWHLRCSWTRVDSGLYSSVAAMDLGQQRLDTIAANLANLATPAFKRLSTSTQGFSVQRAGRRVDGIRTQQALDFVAREYRR